MDYVSAFAKALQALRDEGRYRVFCDIRRDRGQFPAARRTAGAPRGGFPSPFARLEWL